MPRVKIALLSNYPDLTEWYPKQVSFDLKSPITSAWTVRENSKISTVEAAAIADKLGQISTAEYEKMWVTTEKGISEALKLGVSPFSPPFKFQANWIVTVGEKPEAIELEFVSVVKGQELDKLHDAHIVLFLIPAPAEPDPLQIVADKITADPFVNAIPNTAQALLVFLGDGQTPAEKTIQSKLASIFPKTIIFGGKNIGKETFNLAQSVVSSHKILSTDEIIPLPRFISRLLGAVLRVVFGIIVSLVVYNPISSVFAALSRLQNDFILRGDEGLLEEVPPLGILLVSPVWGPLKGLIIDGILEQAIIGWDKSSSLSPFYHIPIFANLTLISTPISKRNIIAGIIISSLVIAAGLAVGLPVVNAALGISTYAALYGLGSLSLAQLALVASSAALVAGSFLYGLGIGMVKLSKVITNVISEQLQRDSEPGTLSKFLGFFVGGAYGALAGMLICNPVSSLFYGMRELRQVIKNDKNESFLTVLGFSLLYLTSFIWLPLGGTIISGLLTQSTWGRVFGLASILGFGKKPMSAGAAVYRQFCENSWAKSDLIAGLVITALMVAAGLAFVITPVSIFLGIPALLTTYGLAGMAPWSLALIAAGVTFAVTSVLYGIGSNGYDLYRDWQDKPAPSVSATYTAASPSSAAKVVQLTGGAQAVHCESQKDSSPGVLEKNLPGPIAKGGKRHPTANTSTEQTSLVEESDVSSSKRRNSPAA